MATTGFFTLVCWIFLLTAEMEELMKDDRLMAAHCRHYVREMRIMAYAQLLESYRSLTLEYMAVAFGVTVECIDQWVCLLLFSFQFLGCVTDVVGATFGEQHVVFSCLYSSLLLMVLHTFAWRLTSLNRVAGSCAYTGSLWSMLLASWSTVLMVKLFLAISIHALVYGESPCWKVLNSVPRGSF